MHNGLRASSRQRLDGLSHLNRIALDRGLSNRFEVQAIEGQRDAVETGFAVCIVLVENGKFRQAQAAQLLDDQRCLIVVGRAKLKSVAVERLMQRHGTCEKARRKALSL